MRVKDPASEEANDANSYPDQEGGIYQVDAGASGNNNICWFVRIMIDGDTISYRAFKAEERWNKPFKMIDEWSCVHKQNR
jgi:hypothetical protein